MNDSQVDQVDDMEDLESQLTKREVDCVDETQELSRNRRGTMKLRTIA